MDRQSFSDFKGLKNLLIKITAQSNNLVAISYKRAQRCFGTDQKTGTSVEKALQVLFGSKMCSLGNKLGPAYHRDCERTRQIFGKCFDLSSIQCFRCTKDLKNTASCNIEWYSGSYPKRVS